jgi:hypothetical protein
MATALEMVRVAERDYPNSVHVAAAHGFAANTALQTGNAIARTEAEIGLRYARAVANPYALASALTAYGWSRIADDPTAALAALDESITLVRRGAGPNIAGVTLCLAAGIRARRGDPIHAARDLRDAVEQAHQNSSRFTLYNCVLWGIYILSSLDHLEQAAVLDGIASTTEYRTDTAHIPLTDAIAHARATLGPEQYDHAYQTGAHMPHDQAVEYTLHVLNDLINENYKTHIA